MKLLHFSYTFVLLLGHIQVIYGNCDAANNNAGVLERAFGPVIATRLQGQLEEIRASFKSGLDEQSGQLEEIIGGKNVESQEFMNRRFDKLSEDLIKVSDRISNERDAMEVAIKAKLEDQSDTISRLEGQSEEISAGLEEQNDKLEDFRQNMESKFDEQKDNIEGFVDKLVKRFEDILGQQKEDFQQELDAMQEKYNQILTAVNFLACPSKWVRVVDSCIWASNEKATFEEAAEKCKEVDSDASLYEPPNKNHNELVSILLKDEIHWIGIHDRFEENTWVYLSTNESVSFTNWHKNQPDNYNNNEHCVEIGSGTQHLWNDLVCESKHKFVCEKKLIK